MSSDILPRTIAFLSYSVLKRTNWNSCNVPYTIQSCLSHDTCVMLKSSNNHVFQEMLRISDISFLSFPFFSVCYLVWHNVVRG